MNAKFELIKKKLSTCNFKLTNQRESIIYILLENKEKHLSAEDVYVFVKNISPEIGLATVYRTLDILNDLEIVSKVNFDDGISRYELVSEESSRTHHHLVCYKCGNITEILEDLLEKSWKIIEKKYNFQVEDHRLTFHGICQNCKT